MSASPLLEAMQALTPDRHADFQAGLLGAGGALSAALLAELFIRARRSHTPLKTVQIAGWLAIVAFAVLSLVRNPTVIDFAASLAGALIGAALVWTGLWATTRWLAERSARESA